MTNFKNINDIPKLENTKIIFREWKESILAYLGKKHLSMFLLHDIQPPFLLSDKVTSTSTMIKLLATRSIKMLSSEDMKTYTKLSNETPIPLIKPSSTSETVAFEDIVIPCYNGVYKFVDAKVQFASSVLSVKHALRRTLSQELLHYIDYSNNVYEGFKKICKHYEKDVKFAKISSRRKLRNIQLRALNLYINLFKKRLAEYRLYGGQEDEEVLEDFISGIPDGSFHAQKSMFTAKKLEDVFIYFQAIEANLS
eukprot:snap_masked-scaffold_30-processed-gene-2.35-mRNA-1 protein AED:1.00 eAED:1.00 QI:0/-1/0/0/-1/1/1/0/252